MTSLNYPNMDSNQVYEYKANSGDFARRTRRRVLFEVFFLALLGVFFWSNWSSEFHNWLKLSVLSIFSGYILFGLALYPKAKIMAEKFSVCLLNNALGFPDQEHMGQIPYCDLAISKVIKKNGKVIEIRLKTDFGQTIKLQGLENMEELYKNIEGRVKTL